MAVAEMSVMTLVALSKDKSAILDELQKSGAVQIRLAKEYALTEKSEKKSAEDIKALIARVEKAITCIYSAKESFSAKGEVVGVKDGFGITESEFFAMKSNGEKTLKTVEEVEKAEEEINSVKSKITALNSKIIDYLPFTPVKLKFSELKNTEKTVVFLGAVGGEKSEGLKTALKENGVISEIYEKAGNYSAVIAVCHKSDEGKVEEILSSFGVKKFNEIGDFTAEEKITSLKSEAENLKERETELLKDIASKADGIRELKIYSDYLSFIAEKVEAEENFGRTETAFLMEAYVPTEREETVEIAVNSVTDAVITEFKVVPRDEFAPTLNENGKISSNFEAVTNLYSAPAYGALDPNAVMSFFFSLFMGVIMADVGYGLLMLIGGLLFAKKQREGTTLYRMANVFAVGGIFAVIFGAVFDSWLGFTILRSYFGEGSAYNNFYLAHLDQINSITSVSGINVPSILMWCLALGTAQIAVGHVLKATQSFSKGHVLDGIFGGIVWAVALFALIFFVFGVATGNASLSTYGGYITVGFLAVGILTSGICEKGAGKIIKPFTSLYGLINYVSDILSYARLYGLMLSGAQIASIFTNTLAIGMLFPNGIAGKIAGVILIIVGNLFNLAINLLGAYIHDARLQYVEFYGKFYEGEGELFTPFGRKCEHTYFSQE